VADALDTLAAIPVAWCTNIILSDPCGEAALIEVAGEERVVRRIGKDSAEQFLCATNHFTAPELDAYSRKRRRESVTRRQTIESRVGAALPQVDRETIRSLLSEPTPDGVCLHHYSVGLGTLWSTIYDVTDKSAEVCFGAPSSQKNQWHTFGLHDPVGRLSYSAHLPNMPVGAEIWESVPPPETGAG